MTGGWQTFILLYCMVAAIYLTDRADGRHARRGANLRWLIAVAKAVLYAVIYIAVDHFLPGRA